MNEIIKRLQRAKLVPAFISIAFGIALIITRREGMEVMVKIAAGMLIACGVGCVLMYLFAPVREPMQFAVGGFMALLGFLFWFNTDFVVNLFPILTGIGLILNGLSNLAPLHAPGENAGTFLTILFSILMIAGGLFIIFNRDTALDVLMVYMGVCYIINGVMDLILLHQVKNVLMN